MKARAKTRKQWCAGRGVLETNDIKMKEMNKKVRKEYIGRV